MKDYRLKPFETKVIEIFDLINAQIKDDYGHVLPASLTSGEVGWLTPETSQVSGRVIQINTSSAMARNFSCGNCTFLCHSPYLSPEVSLAFNDGDFGSLGLIEPSWCGLPCQTYNSCPANQNPTGGGASGTHYSWSSNTSVVSLVSGGASNSSMWQAVSPGSGTVAYGVQAGPPYMCTQLAPVKVAQVPTYLTVVKDIGTLTPACMPPMVPIGNFRQMQMQVVDATGKAMATNVSIQEAWAPTSPADSCPKAGSGAPAACAATGAGGAEGVGEFLDTMTVAGVPNANPSSVCFPAGTAKLPNGCGISVTSTWSLCSGSGTNSLWVSPRTIHSDTITVDGMSTMWSTGTKCTKNGC